MFTVTGDTVDLVMEAGTALEKYFNVVPEESEIEEAEPEEAEAVDAGAEDAEPVEAALPEDVVMARTRWWVRWRQRAVARPPRCPPRTVLRAVATRTRGRRCSRQ